MSETPTLAALTLANPDEEMAADLELVQHLSGENRSEASKRRDFEDGSVLYMRSRMGGEVDARAFASADEAAMPLPPLLDPE